MKHLLVFLLFLSFIFSDSTLVNKNVKIVNLNDSVLFMNNNIKDSIPIIKYGINTNTNLSIYDTMLNDLFYEQLIECKLIFADAITYDISLDTIETEIQFRSLFESFEFLDSLSLDDEYKRIEYNMILNASIDYYQKKSVTVNKFDSPLSMALFKEKLDAYFYKQQLEDIEFVDETVEFIDGHIPVTFNNENYFL